VQGVGQKRQGAAQLLQMMKAMIDHQQNQGQHDRYHQSCGL